MEQFNQFFVDVVKNHYFDFEGRATRRQYWMFVLFSVIIGIIVGIISGIIASIINLPTLCAIVSFIVSLALLSPSLGICVRRLHDTNRSGWWVLISFIPLVGLVLIYFLVLPSDQNSNQYGDKPSA